MVEYKTKFNKGNTVFYIKDNEVKKGVITGLYIDDNEEVVIEYKVDNTFIGLETEIFANEETAKVVLQQENIK